MNGFFALAMRAAPSVLIIVAIVNVVGSLFSTLDHLDNPVVAIAVSLNSGLFPFIAAAVLHRGDHYLAAKRHSEQSDDNA